MIIYWLTFTVCVAFASVLPEDVDALIANAPNTEVEANDTLAKVEVVPKARCTTCKCGVPGAGADDTRIIGGTETGLEEFPWMALLAINGRFSCGGSLINNRYVLTAAHCVHSLNAEERKRVTIRLLEHYEDNSTDPGSVIFRSVQRILEHPNYDTEKLLNDLALLRLDRVVKLGSKKHARPICLPEKDEDFAGEDGVVTGWGYTQYGPDAPKDPISDVLLKVTVPILSSKECRKTKNSDVTDNQICAGAPGGGIGPCSGDSGGPLQAYDGNRYHLAGVVSYGRGCAQPNSPEVFVKVSKYLDWIERNTHDACYCKK